MDGRKVLIVTDGAEPIMNMAGEIAESLKNCEVVTMTAEDFSGTQLLSADMCFFGSETSCPSSFKYLDMVLRHINLAGRGCGIFSSSTAAAEYLKDMVRDSEITLYPDVLLAGNNVRTWTRNVVNQLKGGKTNIGGRYGVKS